MSFINLPCRDPNIFTRSFHGASRLFMRVPKALYPSIICVIPSQPSRFLDECFSHPVQCIASASRPSLKASQSLIIISFVLIICLPPLFFSRLSRCSWAPRNYDFGIGLMLLVNFSLGFRPERSPLWFPSRLSSFLFCSHHVGQSSPRTHIGDSTYWIGLYHYPSLLFSNWGSISS